MSPAALAAAAADAAAGDTDSDRPTFLRDAVDDGGGGGGQILAAGSLDAARAVAVAASPPRNRARPAAASVATDNDDSLDGWRAIAADVMAEGEGSVEASQPPPPPQAEEAAATTPLALPPAGRFLLSYEVLPPPLGSGAFGSVVAVRRRADGARFVAKVGRDASPAAARAALAEVHAMQALTACPHVVRIEEAFLDDCQRVVVVMEAAEGGDVAAWLSRQAAHVPDATCLSIFAQIVAALAAAHAAGIVHRDVKLSNVLIKRRLDGGGSDNTIAPIVALGDFGLAATLSATPTVAGTPACMAPEVLAGSRGCGRPPADVWAAGVALFTLAAGRPPYVGESVGALAGRVVAGPVPELPAGVGGDEVRALLAATLVKDPALRPSAADLLTLPAVAAALRAVEEGEKEADQGVGEAGGAVGPASDHKQEPAAVIQPTTASVDDEDDDAAALAKLVALQQAAGVGV